MMMVYSSYDFFFPKLEVTGLFNYTPAQFNCSRYEKFQVSEYGLYVV